MIRPEAMATIKQWREVIFGAVIALIGLNWLLTGRVLLPYFGVILLGIGALVIYLGIRRVRFPEGGDGPGVVEVDERQITYLAGNGGLAVSIDALDRVEIRTLGKGRFDWHFRETTGVRLVVPGDAKGAEGLLDALVSLPGLNYDQAAQAAKGADDLRADAYLIWQKQRNSLH